MSQPSPKLQTLPLDAGEENILEALLADGGVIVEGVLDRALLDQLNREMDPLLAGAGTSTDVNPVVSAFFGDKVRHVSGLPGKSITFAERVMCHPLYLALCDRVLLPNCADYRLNLGHLMDRGPGSERQWLHRDELVWVHYRDPKPEIQLATIVALVDFTRDNGATCIVPGSHCWDAGREAGEEELAYAEMAAGSAVIYLGSTIHAGGANTTDEWRRGFHMSYGLGWLRTEENNLLAVPPDKARLLSRRAQELVGYGVHDAIEDFGGYLGMLDMQQPTKLLAEGKLQAKPG
jgi:ectoine hydroxylase-related dioxygenase (phytanoyl-CoA dioxygenase family)